MTFVSGNALAASLRRRSQTSHAHREGGHGGGRRSAKLELAFAQIGQALSRRSAARLSTAPYAGEEPSVVDCLLGRCLSKG